MKKFSTLLASCLLSLTLFAQNRDMQSEVSAGIRILSGAFGYGAHNYQRTPNWTMGIAPVVRYEKPFRTAFYGYERYGKLVANAGLILMKPFTVSGKEYTDKGEKLVSQTIGPRFLQLGVGLHNDAKVSFGFEVNYWKGLNCEDLFAAKLLSFGFRAGNMKLMLNGEVVVGANDATRNPIVISLDVLYIIKRRDY